MFDKWTHIHHLFLKLSAHLEMAGISPSFMSYPPAVFSCHCIPASTAQQIRLWQAKFFCHHFLPSLPVLFLPVTVQLSSVTSSEEGCCSVLVDQTLQYSIPLPCNKWRNIIHLSLKGRVKCISEHETLSGDVSPWLPGQNFALLSNFTTLELLSSFPSASCSHCLVKFQVPVHHNVSVSANSVVICDPVYTCFQMQLWFTYVHAFTERGKLCAFTKIKAW